MPGGTAYPRTAVAVLEVPPETGGESSSQGTSLMTVAGLGVVVTPSWRRPGVRLVEAHTVEETILLAPWMGLAAGVSALAVVLAVAKVWCGNRKSESNSPPDDSKGKDEGNDDDQVNETSSTEIEEITVEELKIFYEICQSENKSADDTFKETEKRILAQPDPKKYVTEQLDEKLAKIQEDLRDTKEKVKEISVEIENFDDKKLIIERTKAEKKRDELEKERNALEKEKNVGKLFKEEIFKPTIDPQRMIRLCKRKIEKMSAADKTKEKEAFKWVKTVLVRKFDIK